MRRPPWWHLFQGNGCIRCLCDLGEETFASWELSTEASLLVAVCGSEVNMLLLELNLFLKINKWEKMPGPSHFSLPFSSPFKFCLVSLSIISRERNGTGSLLWNFIGIWSLLHTLQCADVWLPCPYLPPALDHLVLRIPWEGSSYTDPSE